MNFVTFIRVLFVHRRYDVLHCMDYKSLVPVVFSSLFHSKPIIFTKAGGAPKNLVIPSISSIIFYSHEQHKYYQDNPGLLLKSSCKTDVIRGRISFGHDYKIPATTNEEIKSLFG